LSQCGHFADNGETGVNFDDFMRTSFMDGPIETQYFSRLLP